MNTKNRKQLIDLGSFFSERTEETIAKTLHAIEGKSVREKSTRSNYYALKAEHRNYLLLKNLFLTQESLFTSREDAGLHSCGECLEKNHIFQKYLYAEAAISRSNIWELIGRLQPASSKAIKKDSFQIALH